MEDVFIEQLVQKKSSSSDRMPVYGVSLVAAVVFFAGLFFQLLLCILGIALGVLAYFLYKNTDIEYEYCLVNSQLDIDKIIAKSRRKHLVTLELKDAEMIAPKESDRIRHLANPNVKEQDFSTHSERATFVIVIADEKQQMMRVYFDPDNNMMNAIYKMMPSKVFDS